MAVSTEKVEYIIELKDRFSQKMSALTGKTQNLENQFKGLGKTIRNAFIGIGAFQLGKNILQAGIDMEKTKVSFEVMLGSAERARDVIDDLNQFANITPFDNEQVIQTARTLMAFGTEADKLQGTLKMVGDIAAGANVPLNDMAAVYGKAAGQGRLMTEQLNQFAERGVPIYKEFERQLGLSAAEVRDMAAAGELTNDVWLPVLQGMTEEGGMFNGMMEKLSDTAGGKFSTMMGKLQMLMIDIGEKVLPVLSKSLSFVIENFQKIVSWGWRILKFLVLFKAAQKVIQAFQAAVAGARLVFEKLTGAIQEATEAQKKANAAMKTNVYAAMIALVVSLGLQLLKTKKRYDAIASANIKISKQFAEQTMKLKLLRTAYESSNKTIGDKIKLIDGLNTHYSDIIGKTLDYAATEEEIQAAMEKTNDIILKRIEIQAFEDELLNIAKKRLDIENELVTVNQKLNNQQGGLVKKGVNMLMNSVSVHKSVKTALEEELDIMEQQERKLLNRLNLLNQKGLRARTRGVRGGAKATSIVEEQMDINDKRSKSKITAAAPKTFNINIQNVVDDGITINSQTLKEGTGQIQDAIVQAFMGALRDVQTLAVR